eukprot:gnl/TRDRNA2_/TRDRNA2_39498_c0_seq1.p1 gnl/TRDRNA2_/TRDRNA2_39498_c0~~gnl/TRDRNA2_/TRDRNA2_39498_c0_seq1.p1  ORF type:complete len:349 (+),score=47.41 gnl/TRDRNA2_/TRDRNA2_39498_c0_seq1:65-1111(+)
MGLCDKQLPFVEPLLQAAIRSSSFCNVRNCLQHRVLCGGFSLVMFCILPEVFSMLVSSYAQSSRQWEPASAMSAVADGEGVLTFGKHKGRTFADVVANEPDYVSWVLKQPEPSSSLKDFVSYLEAEGVIDHFNALEQMGEVYTRSDPPTGDTQMTFGKHKKRTFADLKDNEPQYVAWALREPEPSSGLKDFVEYLKAEGVSEDHQVPCAGMNATDQSGSQSGVPKGDTVVLFGKHRGRTFADLKTNESEYATWALGQAKKDPSGQLKEFIVYLIEEGFGKEKEPTGDTVLECGGPGIAGRTFADVKANEPAYVERALGLRRTCLSEALMKFVRYCIATGSPDPPQRTV